MKDPEFAAKDPEFAAKDPERAGLAYPIKLDDNELAPAISFQSAIIIEESCIIKKRLMSCLMP